SPRMRHDVRRRIRVVAGETAPERLIVEHRPAAGLPQLAVALATQEDGLRPRFRPIIALRGVRDDVRDGQIVVGVARALVAHRRALPPSTRIHDGLPDSVRADAGTVPDTGAPDIRRHHGHELELGLLTRDAPDPRL